MGGILDNFRARGFLPRKVTRFTDLLKDDIALKTKSRSNILCEVDVVRWTHQILYYYYYYEIMVGFCETWLNFYQTT
jgi:hypothetical protein